MQTISQATILADAYTDTRRAYHDARGALLLAMRQRAREATLAQLAHTCTAAFNASEEAKRACLGQRAMVLS